MNDVLISVALLLGGDGRSFCEMRGVERSIEISTRDFFCVLEPAGELDCQSAQAADFRSHLSLDNNECIESAFALQHDSELVVLYQLEGDDYAGSRVQWVGKGGQEIENLAIGGFNLGEPLQEGAALYVTAIGLIGKIDLAKRSWVWRHDGLFEAFGLGNRFDLPSRVGNVIEFRFVKDFRKPSEVGIVSVRPETGEIVHGVE